MEHEAGTETPARRPRRAVLAAVALFAAGGVAGAALGVTGGAVAQAPAPTESTAPERPERPERPGPGPKAGKGKHGRPFGPGGGIHGEYVVRKPDGGFQTMTTQQGEVTAVSATSIAVRSEDGYTATYVVTADTLVNAARDGIATVRTGDRVHVMGMKDGATTTALRIVDRTRMEAARERFAPPDA